MCQPPENKYLKINEDLVIVMIISMAYDDDLNLKKGFEFEFSKNAELGVFQKKFRC